jgi:ubiquinone/menaquinone biosynthesis C-methylase UbiE
MSFQDHFSHQSEYYLKGRPHYPDELFDFLAKISPARETCWDCGTGNGQAAISLAKYFKKIIATDPSASQIQNGIAKNNIEYRVATAESSGLPDNFVDLVTAATAAHWFEHDKFYAEAKRVGKPEAVIAVWAYSEPVISTEIDEIMLWFMYDYLGDYWPDGRWYVRNKYETLPFPFRAMKTPEFFCITNWNKEQYLDYVRSWSSYSRYIAKHPDDPIDILLGRIKSLWNNEVKHITWKLHLKCAKINTFGSL